MADDLAKSFLTLKQTIPLLLKHEIPAIPTNYALWYTYVSDSSPELKQQLDAMLENNQKLSPSKAKSLYQQHLLQEEEVAPWQLRQSLEAMLTELGQSMKDTSSSSHHFKQRMDENVDNLQKVEQEGWSLEEIMGLVRTLAKDAQEVRRSTIAFNGALADAQREIVRLQSELANTQQQVLVDSLTGLANRRYFDDELTAQLEQSPMSLIFVDIDHFKQVNDNYGHLMGDLVLKAVARKLQQSCRIGDQAFRYGGEEFAVLCSNTSLVEAKRIAERMRKSIEKIRVKNRRTGEQLGDITASFGVAQVKEKMAANQLIEEADKQLYAAKHLGRNRVMPIH